MTHTIRPGWHRVKAYLAVTALAFAQAFVSPLHAQLMRGTVRDSASGRPIAAAVVVALDSLGATLGRNVTNERGQYSLRLSASAWQLRVQRIGFRPVTRRAPSSVNGVAQLDLAMMPIPTFLSSVKVTAQAHCSKRDDRAAAFALLEQARAGLLSTIVAREAHPASLMRLTYERRFTNNTDHIESQKVSMSSEDHATTSFNAAHEAVDFVRRGFMEDAGKGQTFYAPDAEVLLDPGFSNGYCFHIMDADRNRPTQIGLGFRAADQRDQRVDIDGALWIDTVARALVNIEFRYAGLPAVASQFRPGGRISFRDMGNGVVMVDQWALRLIDVHVTTVSSRIPRLDAVKYSAHESGGEIAHASWPDGHRWDAKLGTLRGRATMADGSTAAGREIYLADSPYIATVDSTGQFEMTDLLPGPYVVEIIEPKFAAIDFNLPTTLAFTAVRDSVATGAVQVLRAEDFVRARCEAKDRINPGSHLLLFGRVTAPSDALVSNTGAEASESPVNEARLEVQDRGNAYGLATRHSEADPWKGSGATYKTGSDGLFHVCAPSVTLGATMLTMVRHKDFRTATVQAPVNERLMVVKIVLEPIR